MDECNSHCMYPNLSANISNDQQFRLNKINEIKDYFIAEIKEREPMSKNLSKYIASFEHLDKALIATVIGAPVGIMSASCSLVFSITTGFVKKFLKTIRTKKKKHNEIAMVARSKLNSIERNISYDKQWN